MRHRRSRRARCRPGNQRRAAGQRERRIVGNLHPHRRAGPELVGQYRGLLGGATHQQNLTGSARLLVEPRHQRVECRRRVTLDRRGSQQGRRRVAGARDRQARRLVADQQHSRVRAVRAQQRGGSLGLRQHVHVVDPGIDQGLPQFVGFAVIRPAQPGGDQPVALVGQQSVRAGHRLGQHRDGLFGHIDRGLVDHGGAPGTRPDKRQPRDRTRDRDPQNDVHLRSPSAGDPTASNVRHH
ncbi:hypothetical protein MKSMC1_07640 [Mycobacterium kansasii]|nr:hypothetical protein MKSMC1_07640 [Mycobacterium kansasii]